MGSKEWKRFYDAQSLLNAEESVREQLRAGTYEGRAPIEDEYELDQMVKQAKREEEAGRLFHFDNISNNYDTASYHVEPEDYSTDSDDDEPRSRGFFGRLFGR